MSHFIQDEIKTGLSEKEMYDKIVAGFIKMCMKFHAQRLPNGKIRIVGSDKFKRNRRIK
jgi:hypothetical protein